MFRGLKRWWARTRRRLVRPEETVAKPEPWEAIRVFRDWVDAAPCGAAPTITRVRISPEYFNAICQHLVEAKRLKMNPCTKDGQMFEGVELIRDESVDAIEKFRADPPVKEPKPTDREAKLAWAKAQPLAKEASVPTTLPLLRKWLVERPNVKRVRVSRDTFDSLWRELRGAQRVVLWGNNPTLHLKSEGVVVVPDKTIGPGPLFRIDRSEPAEKVEDRARIASGLRREPQGSDPTLAEALVDLFGLREKLPDILEIALVASYNEPAKLVVTSCIRQDAIVKLLAAAKENVDETD